MWSITCWLSVCTLFCLVDCWSKAQLQTYDPLVFQESRETGQHFTTAQHRSMTRNKLEQTYRGHTSITYKLVYIRYNHFRASPLFLVTWKHRWSKRESGKARRKVRAEWLLSMVLNGCSPCVCVGGGCVCSQIQLLVAGLTWLLNTQKQICFHQNSLTWQGQRGLHWSFFSSYSSADFQRCLPPFSL